MDIFRKRVPRWTEAELVILRDVYPHEGAKAALAALHRAGAHWRSLNSVYLKAFEMGLKAPGRHE